MVGAISPTRQYINVAGMVLNADHHMTHVRSVAELYCHCSIGSVHDCGSGATPNLIQCNQPPARRMGCSSQWPLVGTRDQAGLQRVSCLNGRLCIPHSRRTDVPFVCCIQLWLPSNSAYAYIVATAEDTATQRQLLASWVPSRGPAGRPAPGCLFKTPRQVRHPVKSSTAPRPSNGCYSLPT